MRPHTPNRNLAAVVAIVLGTLLLTVGALDASTAPMRAHRAFDALVQAQGGSMSHSPTYPDTYRSLAGHALLVRAAFMGASGVALVAIGAGAVVADAQRRPVG